MAKKYFTDESLQTLVDSTKSYVDSAVSGKANSSHSHTIANITNLQSTLDGKAASSHTHSSYVNQNAFSNIAVGSTTIAADSVTDTLTLVAGSNVTITPDATKPEWR